MRENPEHLAIYRTNSTQIQGEEPPDVKYINIECFLLELPVVIYLKWSLDHVMANKLNADRISEAVKVTQSS